MEVTCYGGDTIVVYVNGLRDPKVHIETHGLVEQIERCPLPRDGEDESDCVVELRNLLKRFFKNV